MTNLTPEQYGQELYHRHRTALRIVEQALREIRPLIRERGVRYNEADLVWRLQHTAARVERLGFSMTGILARLDPFDVYSGVSSKETHEDV